MSESSSQEPDIDENDPYYKKIKKLIMFKRTYKNLEKKLMETEKELFALKQKNGEKQFSFENDYNYLLIENEQLRNRIQELEQTSNESYQDQKLAEKAIKWKIKYKALSDTVKNSSDIEDLKNQNEELQKQNNELNKQIHEISTNILKMDEFNSKLQHEKEELENRINELQDKNAFLNENIGKYKIKLKHYKDNDEENIQNAVSLKMMTQERDDLRKELQIMKSHLSLDKQTQDQKIRDLFRDNQQLRDELTETQRYRDSLQSKFESLTKENAALKLEKAKLNGQLYGIDRVQKIPVVNMEFQSETMVSTLETENRQLKTKMNTCLTEIHKMYNDLRTLLMNNFVEMPFDLNYDQIIQYLDKKLQDLRSISSDRDILFTRLEKANKQIQELKTGSKVLKEDTVNRVANAQALMDRANEKLEEYGLMRPKMEFQRVLFNKISSFFSLLSIATKKYCCVVDKNYEGINSIRPLLLVSIASVRILQRKKFPFEPQSIVTYASQNKYLRNKISIIKRIENCKQMVLENEDYALRALNHFIYENKAIKKESIQTRDAIHKAAANTNYMLKENKQLKENMNTMYPRKEITKRDQLLTEMAEDLASKENENAYLKIDMRKITKERDLARNACLELHEQLNNSMVECEKLRRKCAFSQMQVEILSQKPKKKRRSKTLELVNQQKVEDYRESLTNMSESIASYPSINTIEKSPYHD